MERRDLQAALVELAEFGWICMTDLQWAMEILHAVHRDLAPRLVAADGYWRVELGT